ncbi:hypothetical protein IMCC3317_01520 [Kordia antarctica]|uniref:YcxB-like C-terminal domain-containing protein n=1 Tax=Kordia antarctica TaxID=1218801 RepID=A0A7L4ZD80_9FLAO|nr:YcxB family protein [Kordia antarctica]QHI34808.1 hypothetical protein IMCC3317_01520 [Kordia antarctica]
MIETKAYQLTQDTFTKIVMQRLFIKKWWIFALFLLAICYYLFADNQSVADSFLTFLIFGYPLFYIGYTFYWSRSKNHKGLLAETNLEFDDATMLFKKNDNEIKIPYKNIIRLEDYEKYWLLYISKTNFIYVPKNIFHTEDDFIMFLTYIND